MNSTKLEDYVPSEYEQCIIMIVHCNLKVPMISFCVKDLNPDIDIDDMVSILGERYNLPPLLEPDVEDKVPILYVNTNSSNWKYKVPDIYLVAASRTRLAECIIDSITDWHSDNVSPYPKGISPRLIEDYVDEFNVDLGPTCLVNDDSLPHMLFDMFKDSVETYAKVVL